MLDINSFDAVFAIEPAHGDIYAHPAINAIRANRRTLGGSLFFDKLLAQLHVKSGHLYPPAKNADLGELHERITTAPIADHYKQSLLFYLLKDCATALEGEDLADDFAKAVCLPRKYWVVVEGLWQMDHLHFTADRKNALESLTHPSLLPTFPEDVLRVLLEHSLDQGLHLPLAYYTTVHPPLTSPDLQQSYFRYLTWLSVTQAYFFLQTQPSQDHKMLLEMLIHEAMSHGNHDERAERTDELVDLPLVEDEEDWFEEYLLEGKGRSLHAARDTVMARRLATGNYPEAVEVGKHLSGRRFNDVTWDGIRDIVGAGLGSRVDIPVFKMPE